MPKPSNWDYALRIKGVKKPQDIPLAKLAEYLKEFAHLMGDAQKPVYAGITKGSALLRSTVAPNAGHAVRLRLLEAQSDAETSAAKHANNIVKMMERDNTEGQIEDRTGAVILQFSPKKKTPDRPKEYLIHDTAALDGMIVGISGVDDTVHIRLQDAAGETQNITVRSIEMARQLAKHFRAHLVRLHVHGTWKRTASGGWEPHSLYGDHFEELDNKSAKEIFQELAELPGNNWASMDDPSALLQELRGAD